MIKYLLSVLIQEVTVQIRIHMIKARPPLPKPSKKQQSDTLLKLLNVLPNRPKSREVPSLPLNKIRVQQPPSLRHPSISQNRRPLSSCSSSSNRDLKQRMSLGKVNRSQKQITEASSYHKLPKVTAKSWILYQMKEERCISGFRQFKRRQIASLTKILNLVTILRLVSQMKLGPSQIKAKASKRASNVIGTTANLKQGCIYSLKDLYYGMMLPSGNDAATMIAQIGGCILKMKERESKQWNKLTDVDFLSSYVQKQNGTILGVYLQEMNRLGKELGMLSTNIANPHGLSNFSSYSTANDLTKLCSAAMKNSQFRQIVKTQRYTYQFQQNTKSLIEKENNDPNSISGNNNNIIEKGIWENTNKLLVKGWSGIKTGITPHAGPCLAASFQSSGSEDRQWLVILLDSESMDARWQEASDLVSWAQECEAKCERG